MADEDTLLNATKDKIPPRNRMFFPELEYPLYIQMVKKIWITVNDSLTEPIAGQISENKSYNNFRSVKSIKDQRIGKFNYVYLDHELKMCKNSAIESLEPPGILTIFQLFKYIF